MKRLGKKIGLFLAVFIMILGTGIFFRAPFDASASSGRLTVSFIDVGQGDSFLLESNGSYLLIDGGPVAKGPAVVKYLKERGVKHLDYVISTHPHNDHSGGLYDVVNNFTIGTFYKTNAFYNHNTYFKLLNALNQKKVNTALPIAGKSFKLGSAEVLFIAPNNDVNSYAGLNDTSIVVKVINGDNSFLFTGDAETISENEMIEKGYDLKSDVLKVGHHSALTSTSIPFLNAVNPSISIISCEKDHAAKFPRITTLRKLCYSDIYRTDLSGTITLTSNGKEITADKKPYSIAVETSSKPFQNLKNLTAKGSLGNIQLLNLNADQNFDTVFNSPFIITFQANYGVSSLDKIQYVMVPQTEVFDEENAQWQDFTGNMLAVEDDFYGSIYVKYRNKFGHETIRMTNGFCLDQTAPEKATVKSNLANMKLLDLNGSNSISLKTSNKVTLKFDAEFGLSYEQSIEYMIVPQGEKFDEMNEWTLGDSVTINEEFSGRVFVRFMDRAGNKTIKKTTGFKIVPKAEKASK